jgi:glycosyltransferase involved in cell wall biosynthesis
MNALDVTDLVEFLQRQESVSGVQRVIAETAPFLLAHDDIRAVVLDRGRGVFVPLTLDETSMLLLQHSSDRPALVAAATASLARAREGAPLEIEDGTVLTFLGAAWINDALMMAARDAQARGARLVFLLFDLTPVLEAGHTAAVNRLFDRYLNLITQCASAVPAISESSRRDYEFHCTQQRTPAPPGGVTGLPCGLTPGQYDTSESPWPRPYALLVGTVESRKNHIVALRAWQQMIEQIGAEAVPDLVCIGRLGWHANEFLHEYVMTQGLGGKVSLLSTSVPDEELARFYAHAQFTVYPSRYEGWGLPVSESIAFGKLPIVASNSSLAEAGRDLAVYVETGSASALADAVRRHGLGRVAREAHEARIAADSSTPITWARVADIIRTDMDRAAAAKGRQPVFPEVELNREYMLAVPQPAPDGGHADKYLAHLQSEGLTPMFGQPRGERDFEVVDPAVVGELGSPQTWGVELRPGRRVDVRLRRPADGPLTLLMATRSMPGVAVLDAVGPGGPSRQEVYLGSVVSLALGDGMAGDPAQVSITVLDAHDSVEGFLGLRSFAVVLAGDLRAEVAAQRAAAQALRQELDFIQGTRSWKVTAPLRKMKGRGAS